MKDVDAHGVTFGNLNSGPIPKSEPCIMSSSNVWWREIKLLHMMEGNQVPRKECMVNNFLSKNKEHIGTILKKKRHHMKLCMSSRVSSKGCSCGRKSKNGFLDQ